MSGIIATLFLFFDATPFSVRFDHEFSRSQFEAERVLRQEYFVHFREMMWLLVNAPNTGEAMRERDLLRESSMQVTAFLKQGFANFSFDHFSVEETQRIHDFFEILLQIDAIRHHHALKMIECVQMTLLQMETAEEFCQEEEHRYREITSGYRERFPKSFPDLLVGENAFLTLFLRS
ncbi:hypothetical protein IPN35_05630 [Candidatus Peregrinibacteria bacterium]|nr:MAG: hypothetical protein IPN35_05630 [Candidatus Peregrinibacteria bacterium]